MNRWEPLKVDWSQAPYRRLVGVGGIGGGSFFALKGAHTLGREESRSGRFLDRRDYCKLHIISHYVQTLLGPEFTSYPIGYVGEDDLGRQMLKEMAEAGMNTRFVQALPGEQTMTSICLVYPDGSGGNLTTDDSANERLTPEVVEAVFQQILPPGDQSGGIVLAAPEVSLEARLRLLQLGKQAGFYNFLAINSDESASTRVEGLLEQADFLALNLDEASALCRAAQSGTAFRNADVEALWSGYPEAAGADEEDAALIVEKANLMLMNTYPPDTAITAAKEGSWVCQDGDLRHLAPLPVTPVGTSGAGDAFLAGLIVGKVAGLSLFEAHELANLVAAFSVTSPHTIHPNLDRLSLNQFTRDLNLPLSLAVEGLLL
jgi:sugar/nucleoside kinase (ribokinase family)